MPIPPYTNQMPFMVIGWDGAGKDADTHAGRAALCYYLLAKGVPNAISKCGKDLKWKGTDNLLIQPAVGFAINANYDRKRLNFYFAWDDIRQKMIYTAGSVDVIAHEFGHALLDSLRPDFWNFVLPEIGAFHESFGDMHGIASVMQHDRILVKSLIDTGGDLGKSNLLSQVGIEMGTCLFKCPVGVLRPLRDASIVYKYVPPSQLPADAAYDQLSTEPHSLSRVFTSACYAIMVEMYNQMVSGGMNGLDAVRKAGNDIMSYLFLAVQECPATSNLFQAMANSILAVDARKGGTYAGIIIDVFAKWNLPVASGISAFSVGDRLEITPKTKTISYKSEGLSIQSHSVLSGLKMEIPLDECRRYDASGNLKDSVLPDEDEIKEHAMRYAEHLAATGRIGDDKEFRIEDGMLVRNQTYCCKEV